MLVFYVSLVHKLQHTIMILLEVLLPWLHNSYLVVFLVFAQH
jgi:hypothetical protein